MRLTDWLHNNGLVLAHPGHGHNETDSPVGPEEQKRLDAEFHVISVADAEVPIIVRGHGHPVTRSID